ncbi:uncharacterized protein EI97DRAFT_450918 [Westerdykella ornata]|uniref:Uncharacterized protein n=1 Tax=Westerdykella ornata TaxID=318751 RepID=A0A6A6JGR9_WESOR|nr:uncharacterized protein EI97DRAFT_450918 [Westerdykella ornata]KAF2275751.1 hypothetical protein EI97DRAFT_450918 [Westerdykella ornata]
MNGISSSTRSFFSFGPNESYISNSYEGLTYRNLPLPLYQLIISGRVVSAHWAALGPVQESWLLSYTDGEGKNNLAWGEEIPWELEEILGSIKPNPHIYVYLGPKESFIAWGPSFIRWTALPSGLEASLQGWLTPSGWRAGPPRIVTWGRKGAYFALSEYGEVKYRTGSGDSWRTFKETVEEWEAEAGFSWNDLAYITLDSTVPDQFVMMRVDRTWAGSIGDGNEQALEAFVHNFFTSVKSKSKTQPNQKSNDNNRSDGGTNQRSTVPDAATRAHYEKWAAEVSSAFSSALAAAGGKAGPKKLEIRNGNPRASTPQSPNGKRQAKLLTSFPYLPSEVTICELDVCRVSKVDPGGLRACRHDVERFLRASGQYSKEFLRQERIRWHPDRFGRLCSADWRDDGRRLAEEMFKIIDNLIADLDTDQG